MTDVQAYRTAIVHACHAIEELDWTWLTGSQREQIYEAIKVAWIAGHEAANAPFLSAQSTLKVS